MNLSFKKGDAAAALLVIVIAVIVFFALPSKSAGAAVAIYKDGEVVEELSLYTNDTVVISGEYTNKITINNGEVFVSESDCPGNDCVHQGRLSTSGSIICLPNRVEIRVSGESGVDTSTN